jgi:hypothetical protein
MQQGQATIRPRTVLQGMPTDSPGRQMHPLMPAAPSFTFTISLPRQPQLGPPALQALTLQALNSAEQCPYREFSVREKCRAKLSPLSLHSLEVAPAAPAPGPAWAHNISFYVQKASLQVELGVLRGGTRCLCWAVSRGGFLVLLEPPIPCKCRCYRLAFLLLH